MTSVVKYSVSCAHLTLWTRITHLVKKLTVPIHSVVPDVLLSMLTKAVR
jgi:hypothetical protein